MNNELKDLLYFMQIISGNAILSEERLNRINWQYIRKSSRKNALGLFLYDLIYDSNVVKTEKEKSVENREFWEDWRGETQWSAAKELQKQYALKRVVELAQNQGLTPVLFKGCILAELYYDPILRVSSDSDIFIEKEEQEQMEKILSALGYQYVEEKSKPQVPVFYHMGIGHVIELHNCLWEDYTGSKMQLLESLELTRRDTLVQQPVLGFTAITMEPTRHLVYQMFHIIKHFTVKGVGLRYLLDITLFIKAYIDQMDLKYFWASMDKLGYQRFCEDFFMICENCFGMPQDLMEGHRRVLTQEKKELFLLDMMNLGDIFSDNSMNWEMLTIMKPYLEGETTASQSKSGRILHLLFPTPKELPDHCGYAKKCVILLPVAWVHKWILFLFRRITKGRNKMSASKKIQATEYRINMLREMGLLKDE